MKCLVGAIALFFSTWASAQTPHLTVAEVAADGPRVSPALYSQFTEILPSSSPEDLQDKYSELNYFVQQLDHRLKKSASVKQFLRYLFYRVHRSHLKQYQSYATLNELLTDGKYDCVSGTALYALLLEALRIDFSIQETTYHVYLVVPLGDDVAILESTDPTSGLVIGSDNVAQRLAQYRNEEVNPPLYAAPIQARVGMSELLGLTHFNAAVNYYNQQQLEPARQHLQRAIRLYPADRMYALQTLIESLATR